MEMELVQPRKDLPKGIIELRKKWVGLVNKTEDMNLNLNVSLDDYLRQRKEEMKVFSELSDYSFMNKKDVFSDLKYEMHDKNLKDEDCYVV